MKKIKIILPVILLLILFFYNPAYSQDKSVKKQLQGFDEFVESAMKDWNVPGVAIAIVKDSTIVYAKGYGYRNIEKKLHVTPQTLFAIGSTTKAMTAVTVCQLVDDGLLDLDKPVKDYIPSFRMYDDYVTNHMTPRDLMCHRSGLPRHDFVWYGSDLTRKDLFETLQYLEPSKGFRSAYQYQNLMFMTAGYLVEQITGERWEQVVQKRIFDPLEITRSNFSVNDSKKDDDFSLPYAEKDGKIEEIPFRNIDAIGPAGSVNSCVSEMGNWLIMQLNNGKFKNKQIISEGMIKQTRAPHVVTPGEVTDEIFYSSYGLGWVITSYRGHLLVSHGGGIDGFITQVALLPRDSTGVVVLTNLGSSNLSAIIRNNVLDRMLGMDEIDWNKRLLESRYKARKAREESEKEEDINQKKGTFPSHPLEEFAGKFKHPAYGILEVKHTNGELSASLHDLESPLKHYHYDIFEATDDLPDKLKLSFHTNLKGKINKVSSKLQEGVKEIVFERVIEGT